MSNKEIIAVVKLQPGQGGYYDELSRVHLTIGNPQANIYAGTNCEQLRRSVKSGRLRLVSGTFGPDTPPFQLVKKGKYYVLAPNNTKTEQRAEEVQPVIPAKEETIKAAKEETPAAIEEIVEEAVQGESVSGEAVEEAVEEAVTETQKKSRGGKRTAKKEAKKTEKVGE